MVHRDDFQFPAAKDSATGVDDVGGRIERIELPFAIQCIGTSHSDHYGDLDGLVRRGRRTIPREQSSECNTGYPEEHGSSFM